MTVIPTQNHLPVVTDAKSLSPLLAPRTVAVIGATETAGSVGRTVTWNLLSHPFGGVVHPVNPKRQSVLGVRAFPRVSAIPDQVDLAVIITPATTVPGIIAECIQCGVKAAIIISAGFTELGEAGRKMQEEIAAQARRGGMRILGPNCLGIANPLTGLNATFAGSAPEKGNLAFISQSGALCCAILDWARREKVGFSGFASVGSMLDVGWADLLDWYGNDPATKAILLYLETVGEARAFLSAAREVALAKPVIAIKAGRTAAGAEAASIHTGAAGGDDAVIDAALDRAGVIRVDTVEELFSLAEILSKLTRPTGDRLAVVTNAGGPGVLACDALVRAGGTLAQVSPTVRDRLDRELGVAWSRANPVDLLGDADAERYRIALNAIAADPAADGLLVILTPQDMTDPLATAKVVVEVAAAHPDKPVLAAWMGGPGVEAGRALLAEAGVPVFAFSDAAARAFAHFARHAQGIRALYSATREPPRDSTAATARQQAGTVLDSARREGRQMLTESESKSVLAAYGVPVIETVVANNQAEAASAAAKLGFPVVVKLHSRTVGEKAAVGGVRLGLATEAEVKAAVDSIEEGVYTALGGEHFHGVTVQRQIQAGGLEILVRVHQDPQFGPVLSFGAGGGLAEVVGDVAVALPPLTRPLARRLVERTRIGRAILAGKVRACPPDSRMLAQLEDLLVKVSRLVVEQPWISSLEVNPLHCSSAGVMALDARLDLHHPDTAPAALPRPAIRPYPTAWEGATTLADGSALVLRPITPEDEPLMVAFHHNLSEATVRDRYDGAIDLPSRIAHDRLVRLCHADYDREAAVAVIRPGREGTPGEIVAIGRLSRRRLDPLVADVRVVVADRWQRRGLGAKLMAHLLVVAKGEGLRRLESNVPQQRGYYGEMCRTLGFAFEAGTSNTGSLAVLDLV